jgi:polyisoprenoid-binding protein YceI
MEAATQKGLAIVKFQIDPTASRFTVQAFATGLLSVFGHNPRIAIRDYQGEIQFVPETFDKAYVRMTVQTAGMEVLDEMKRDDRQKLAQEMNQNVLDIDRYPTSNFESTEISVTKLGGGLAQAHVMGELSFRGVTRSHSFGARVSSMGGMLRISGEFTLRQSDYGIVPVSFAGGALRLKDEVKFSFEMVARSQD